MTVHTYRFRRTEPVDQAKLRAQVGLTATIAASDGGQVVDITSDDATDDADDLKEQMVFLGFSFLELDPAGDPADDFTPSGGAAIGFEEWTYADDLTVPVTADWAINVVAPLDEEALNSALHALMFDDTTEEGGATHRTVPSGAVRMIFKTITLPASAPGGAVGAVYHLRVREVTDGGDVGSWGTPVALTDIDFPASEVWHQKDETDNTLATWGLTVGKTYQFLASRNVADGDDDLSGDCGIFAVGTEWTT